MPTIDLSVPQFFDVEPENHQNAARTRISIHAMKPLVLLCTTASDGMVPFECGFMNGMRGEHD